MIARAVIGALLVGCASTSPSPADVIPTDPPAAPVAASPAPPPQRPAEAPTEAEPAPPVAADPEPTPAASNNAGARGKPGACPWPKDAPDEVTNAVVMVRAQLREDGSVVAVEVLDDPGNGFGDAARQCVLEQGRFAPAPPKSVLLRLTFRR